MFVLLYLHNTVLEMLNSFYLCDYDAHNVCLCVVRACCVWFSQAASK